MDALATSGQLIERLGRPLEGFELARAEALLKDASSAVRDATGQTISQATTTVRLSPQRVGCDWGILLPQYPVVSVDTVVDDDATDVDVEWTAGAFIRTAQIVTVTYTHGYDPVPDDVIAVVCQITGRAIAQNTDNAGVQSETLGGYSYSIGAAAAAGPFGMLNDERRVLRKYKRPVMPIPMTHMSRTNPRADDLFWGWR